MAGITAVFINNHYRTRLRLGKFGFIGMYVPNVILPAIITTFYHRAFIQPSILLQKAECPLCLQLRAAAVQGFFGTVYPTILTPFAGYMVSNEAFSIN